MKNTFSLGIVVQKASTYRESSQAVVQLTDALLHQAQGRPTSTERSSSVGKLEPVTHLPPLLNKDCSPGITPVITRRVYLEQQVPRQEQEAEDHGRNPRTVGRSMAPPSHRRASTPIKAPARDLAMGSPNLVQQMRQQELPAESDRDAR